MLRDVSEFRYKQFCPLARAAEVIGERWTLLVIRELLLGPVRFSELRRRLSHVSPSVLSARVQGLEARGFLERRELPPPASVAVLELTELGETLRPVVVELTRFGLQLLGAPEPEDHFEPSWLRLGLHAVAASEPTPELAFRLSIEDGQSEFVILVRGGPDGTVIRDVPQGELPESDVQIRAQGLVVMALAAGNLDPIAALEHNQIEASGRIAELPHFSRLFNFVGATHPDN